MCGGGVHGRGACVVGGVCGGGHAWQGGMHGRGACMAGVCVAGGMHAPAPPPSRYCEIRSMSRQYASYWNAFLFLLSVAYIGTYTYYFTILFLWADI